MSQKVHCVAAVLRNPQGQVLLQQREKKPYVAFAGCWTLPGGKVEDGEAPDNAVKRELMEEIELEVPLDLWKVYERPGPHSITIVQYVYTGQIDRAISDLALNEGQALQYFASQDIDTLYVAYGFDSLLDEYFAIKELASAEAGQE